MQKTLLIFLLTITYSIVLFGQNDTLILDTDALGIKDLTTNENTFLTQKVVSASRSLQELKDLPFTIYVITKEEIHAKGYNTLADALKWIPGIRVSQPGSGLEGETFMMRGLQGNTYTKILVNDIPVKSYSTRGMPIGAQLPIRQAERIEVIFGPAAAVYGADASAGVINIVTKESERPLFTQAEISLGADEFSSLHVMFGGKLGKGKRILKYSVIGSNTSFQKRRIFKDTSFLFNPALYDSQGDYLNNANFSDDLNATPHLSRLVGLKLDFQDLHFSFLGTTRRDHASLGLNPSAVAYDNPNNFIEDNSTRYHLDWSPTWNKWGMKLGLNWLQFNRKSTSSNRYVENNLKNLFDHVIPLVSQDSMEVQQARTVVYNRYFSNDRYLSTHATEVNLEYLTFFTPIKEIELLFGGKINVGASDLVNFQRQPDFSRSSLSGDFSYSLFEGTLFAQSYINLKKIKGIASLSYSKSNQYAALFTPRIALLFPVNKNLGIRAFYGTSFRPPSIFYYANSFSVWLDEPILFFEGNSSSSALGRNRTFDELQPEENTTIELGVRWSRWKNLSVDANFYYSKTDNILTFIDRVPRRANPLNPQDTTAYFFTGYTNFGDSHLKVFGGQASIYFSNKMPNNQLLQAKLGLNVTYGDKRLPGNFEATLGNVPEQPEFSAQLQLTIPLGAKWSVYLDNLYHGFSVSEAAVLEVRDFGQFNRETLIIPKYYTLDMLIRYNVSKNFSSYIQVINVFNKQYGGLSATGTSDDLFYNAQSERIWRLGLSYNLD